MNVWFYFITRLLIYTKFFQMHGELYQLVRREQIQMEL